MDKNIENESKKNLLQIIENLQSQVESLKLKENSHHDVADFMQNAKVNYKDILELLPDAIYILRPNGIFTYISESIKFLGYEPNDLIGRHFSEIIHPEDLPFVSRDEILSKFNGKEIGENNAPKLFDERRTGERMTQDLEVRLLPREWKSRGENVSYLVGSIFSCGKINSSGHYKVSMDEDRDFLGSIGVIRDITDRKRFEIELQKVQRSESISIIASGLAHDFNNILTAVIGNISLAKLRSDNDNLVYDSLMNAENALVQAKDLASQLLSFSMGRGPVKETARIVPLIEDSYRFSLSGTGTVCKLDMASDLRNVEIDIGQICQVINNLILNASQAMDGFGVIDIRTENITTTEYLHDLKPGEYIRISIIDEGPGISNDIIDKIFDPYFTTKQKGSGLGLATCFSIIKNHGGYIAVESAQVKGTTFSVYLPAIPGKY